MKSDISKTVAATAKSLITRIVDIETLNNFDLTIFMVVLRIMKLQDEKTANDDDSDGFTANRLVGSQISQKL